MQRWMSTTPACRRERNGTGQRRAGQVAEGRRVARLQAWPSNSGGRARVEAELHALARLLDVHDAAGCRRTGRAAPPVRAAPAAAAASGAGRSGGTCVVVAGRVGDEGAHVQRRPARHGLRAEHEAADRSAVAGQRGVPGRLRCVALLLVELVADARRTARPGGSRSSLLHGADAERALDQRVGPPPVEVEPADRLLRAAARCRRRGRRTGRPRAAAAAPARRAAPPGIAPSSVVGSRTGRSRPAAGRQLAEVLRRRGS